MISILSRAGGFVAIIFLGMSMPLLTQLMGKPAAVDTDRGDNNAKKFPTQAFKIKHLHFDYRINTNNGAATVKPV